MSSCVSGDIGDIGTQWWRMRTLYAADDQSRWRMLKTSSGEDKKQTMAVIDSPIHCTV